MRKMLMKNIIFKYISIILVSLSLFACQMEEEEAKEENKQNGALEEHMAGMDPKAGAKAVIEEEENKQKGALEEHMAGRDPKAGVKAVIEEEEDKQKGALEEHMAGMDPKARAEFQAVIEEYEEISKIIDKSAPIHLTMDLQSAFDKIYCKTPGFIGGITSAFQGSSNLATCSEGRIAVCGTQGDSTEVKPYCVIHDAEADKYYRVTSETPDDHCEEGKKVVCNE